jgi:hypothetical protein
LEQSVGLVDVVQRTDLDRYVKLCLQGTPCLAKLHGSTSFIDSLVFTTEDYDQIRHDKSYLTSLQEIFSFCSVVFLGYGLQDKYVVDLLADEVGHKSLFGAGPHFMVSSSVVVPSSAVLPIRYDIAVHPDHRAAMTVLDFLQQSIQISHQPQIDEGVSASDKSSIFYITEFNPPGQHNTSQTLALARTGLDTTMTLEATVGLGWIEGELPSSSSHALHDLLVGLVCFDRTLLPFDRVGAALQAIGEDVFLALLKSGGLGFVYCDDVPAAGFPLGEVIGNLALIRGQSDQGGTPLDLDSWLRRVVHPITGKQAEYEQVLELIKSCVIAMGHDDSNLVPNMTRNSLLMPKVSRMLGFGDAILPTQVPKWLKFPVLRMAHLVQTSQFCKQLGVVSARLLFGGAALVSAAFGVGPASIFVDHYASYIVSSLLQVNLEQYIATNPKILLKVLDFRNTQPAADFRKHVLASLKSEEYSEFGGVVDAGLAKIIPSQVLESARQELHGLLFANGAIAQTPAVWTNPSFSEATTRAWRDVARENLLKILKERGASSSSKCLFGSGDPVRSCCLEALRTL